jgi:hypothetical protein
MKRIFLSFGLVFLLLISTELSLLSQNNSQNSNNNPLLEDTTFSRIDKEAATGNIPPAQSTTALKQAMIKRVAALQNLEFSADMTVKFNGMTQMGNCDAKLCSSDSMCVTIHGPFGIFVGKMFATPTNFVFYDAFNNRAVTGVPNADNIAKTLRIPLAGEDFAHLMRGESPNDNSTQFPKDFTVSSEKTSNPDNVLFERRSEILGAEYVLFSLKDNVILQFQKKSQEGKIQLNVKYSNFKNINDIILAQHIDIQSPENDASAVMELSNFKINQAIPTLRFSLPKGLQIIPLD